MNLERNKLRLKNRPNQNKTQTFLLFCLISNTIEKKSDHLYVRGKKADCEGCFLVFVELTRSLPAVWIPMWSLSREHWNQAVCRIQLVSLVKAYSIFKTSQEHAVPHFIKHNYSPSSVKMSVWPASRFSGERNKGLDSNNLGVCPVSWIDSGNYLGSRQEVWLSPHSHFI